MELEEESREVLTINTHNGLFRFNWMAFGVDLPLPFGREPWIPCYREYPMFNVFLDDIVVTGGNVEEHHLLERVF